VSILQNLSGHPTGLLLKELYKIKETILFFPLIIYLLFGTGICSDDFADILTLKDTGMPGLLIPQGLYISAPLKYYTHHIWFHFVQIDSFFLINFLKIIFICLSFYLTLKFFTLYLNNTAAGWIAFFFIFYPSHDATAFFFPSTAQTLSFSLYLFAFYQAFHDKYSSAFLLALIASFMYYGTPVVAISLFILFVLQQEYKKGMIILLPNLMYSFLYYLLSKHSMLSYTKLPGEMDFSGFLKHFLLQIITFIDAMTGPAIWLKIYYSIHQLSLVSFIIGIFISIAFYKTCGPGNKNEKPTTENAHSYKGIRKNRHLLICLTIMALASFLIFAITGKYPQMVFNLGNRTTFWGALLFTYLIVNSSALRKFRTLLSIIIIFSILGISDHWKKWNNHQQQVIAELKSSEELRDYNDERIVYVSGNQYSNYGKMSHIEFFSEDWVVGSIFLLTHNTIAAKSLNKRHKYQDGYLIDTKYDKKTDIQQYIYVYNSESNMLLKLEAENINPYIGSLPKNCRHWIMLSGNSFFKFLKSAVTFLSPRLKYVLDPVQ
jgi:hypothetical protein